MSDNTNKKTVVRNLFLILMVAFLVGAVWLYKNQTRSQGSIAPSVSETISGYFPLDVTEPIDLEELKSYGLPIIIDFGADSCGPCIEMAPVLEALNQEFAGQAIVLFVDVFKYQELMEGFPVQVLPTQIFIDATGSPYQPRVDSSLQYTQYTYRDTGELAFTTHQGTVTEEQLREVLSDMGVESND